MVLKKKESDLFYSLVWYLLGFVANTVLSSKKDFELIDIFHMDNRMKGYLFENLWKNTNYIDEFIELNPNMKNDDKELLLSWKQVISSMFIVEHHSNNGTVFIDLETNKVYLVYGIVSDYDEMFHFTTFPLLVKANLLPFKGKIITDGILTPYPDALDSESKAMSREIYINAKKTNSIIRSF